MIIRGWLLTSLAVLAVCALAGCGSARQVAGALASPSQTASAGGASSPTTATVPASPGGKTAAGGTPSAHATGSSSAGRTSSAAPGSSASPAGTQPGSAASNGGTSGGGTSGGSGSASSSACTSSAAMGICGPYPYASITGSNGSNTHVEQDVWNPISGWSQTLHANSPDDWSVTANMPAGNTAVISYPDVQQLYSGTALSKFSSIYSSFSEDMHATSGTVSWAAYDIWLNNWGNEVMFQHDFAGQGLCPSVASASFGGSGGVPVQQWILCKNGSELVWHLTSGNESSGTVDVLSMLTWLENHGYLPSTSTLTAIDYGWEICSTGGSPQTYTLNRYSITSSS
jgi:hypothetical protein